MSGGVLRQEARTGEIRELSGYRARLTKAESTSYVGMVIFLGSWAMMFAALFFSYAIVRARAVAWPPPGEPRLPVLLPGLNTLVIGGSSVVMAAAVRAHGLGRRRLASMLLLGAAGLGAVFLALQGIVWVGIYRAGLAPSSGPYGSVFYALTAFHGLHVLVGLAALLALATCLRAARGASRSSVRLWGMYWHFVGVVWAALYLTVYLA